MEPSQIIQYVLIGIIIAAIAFDKARGAFKRRNNNPGYGERIAKLETAVEGIEDDLKIIKERLNLV